MWNYAPRPPPPHTHPDDTVTHPPHQPKKLASSLDRVEPKTSQHLSIARIARPSMALGKDELGDALRQAARTNNVEKIKSLIAKGADPNAVFVCNIHIQRKACCAHHLRALSKRLTKV